MRRKKKKAFAAWLVVLLTVATGQTVRAGHDILQNVNFNTEGEKRERLRRMAKPQERGYRYDIYEQQKEMIFRQLEVITGDEDTRYRIVPGDTLTISYMDRGRKEGAVYKVSSEGKIYLPLVGPVKVSGLNRRQARAFINEMFQQYIRHPQVDIAVNTSGRIMILGAVNRPGLYLLDPNLTVMEAILKARSYNRDEANLKSVMLMRGGPDKPEVKRLNLWKMIKKGDRSDDLLVKPGDIIFVPNRFIVNLDRFKSTVYRWVSTYYGFGRLPSPPVTVEGEKPIILYDR